jgi:hypothetical protein
MIVDVITNGIFRVSHAEGDPNYMVTELYAHPNPHMVCKYADAELSDIRAFGLNTGLVRVMGGVRSMVSSGGGLVPVPATPRVYNFYVNEPIVALAFSPDGTSLGILYPSCLVVMAGETRQVYYFGPGNEQSFEGLYMSDDFVYVTTTTEDILKFNLVGPWFDMTPIAVRRECRTFITATNEWVAYDSTSRTVTFGSSHQVVLPPLVGRVLKLVPALDRNYVWAVSETELLLVSRYDMTVVVFEIRRLASIEHIVAVPCHMGVILGSYDPDTKLLHVSSFCFDPAPGEIVNMQNVSVPFDTPPRALALPSSPLTRFHAPQSIMIMHPITRADVVYNQHFFESDEESEEEESVDEAQDEESDGEEVPNAVLDMSFRFPQPATGLQLIIQRTREYLQPLPDSSRLYWTPAQFEEVVAAAHVYKKHLRLLNRQAAMFLYAKENYILYKQAIEDCVQHFASFYGGSASMGTIGDENNEIELEPYQSIASRTKGSGTPEEAERILRSHLDFSHLAEVGVGPDLFESREFRVDMAFHLATQFQGVESDTIHSVNAGIISTLNCHLTDVRDLVQCLTTQRKLMKMVARILSRHEDDDDEDFKRSKRPNDATDVSSSKKPFE